MLREQQRERPLADGGGRPGGGRARRCRAPADVTGGYAGSRLAWLDAHPLLPGQPGFVVPAPATGRARPSGGARPRRRRGRPDAALPGLRPRPRPGGALVGDPRRWGRPGESDLEAAVRELWEETGLVVDAGDLVGPLLTRNGRARLQRQGRRPGRGLLRRAGAGVRGRHDRRTPRRSCSRSRTSAGGPSRTSPPRRRRVAARPAGRARAGVAGRTSGRTGRCRPTPVEESSVPAS